LPYEPSEELVTARIQFSGRFTSELRVRLLTTVWALLVGVLATVAGTSLFGMAAGHGALLGLAVAAVAWPVLRRSTREGVDVPLRIGRRIGSLEQVDEALRALDRQLADPRLAERARSVVELDRAAVLADRAMLADRPDHLDEAIEIAERHARNSGYLHHHRFQAACELVEARNLQAQRNRDDHGWLEALRLQAEIAGEAGAAVWQAARCAHDQGDRFLYLAQEAELGSAVQVQALRRALALFQEALRGFGPRSGFAPLLHTKIANQMLLLARLEGGHRLPDLDHEIGELSRSLRHYRGRRRAGRELVEITLARLLLERVDEEEDLNRGLVEAERLCGRYVDRGPEIRGMAHATLAEALRLRRELAESPAVRADPGLRRARVAHLREAFLAERELSVADATDAGEAWAEAAAELADRDGDIGGVTAAYSELARQVPVDVLRRLDERKRVAFVAARQGIAAEAGYWLCRAEQPEKAVLAVEQARTILLGLLTRRLPDDVEVRLRAAGRIDLLGEYEQAVGELQMAERTRYSGARSDPTRLHRAWGRYDRIAHLVDDVVGVGAEGGDPLAEARRAAGDGVLVYLGVAQRGGYAIVVPSAGPLACVPLTEVTLSELDHQVERYRAFLADPYDREGRLSLVLAWLWTAALDPLLARLPSVSVLTLVPLGELALLPLHAAGTDDVRVDERVAVAYAPSARLVSRSGARAARSASALAMVSVPVVPWSRQLPELEYAATEASAVARCYGVALRPHTMVDEALNALWVAEVWHLACHGRADPDDPMASYLALADRGLSLRETMATRPGTHRVAVLSACESAIPDRSRPDEVIGFPGALLQAGVAGVVASGWRVRQDAAACLSIRFHQLWRAGTPPAAALAGAQRWMRGVTRGELADEFGGSFLPRPGTPTTELHRWRAQRPFTGARLWAAFSFTGS
jgi:CHAT domain-containing protein